MSYLLIYVGRTIYPMPNEPRYEIIDRGPNTNLNYAFNDAIAWQNIKVYSIFCRTCRPFIKNILIYIK